MKRSVPALPALALALSLALAGCGTSQGPRGDYGGGGTITPSTSSPGATSPGSGEAQGTTGADVAKFGEPWAYEDGLTVTVTAPEEFEPTGEGAGSPLSAVRMEVTVENGTGKEFDPTLIAVGATSAEAAAEPITDSTQGLTGSPESSLGSGERVTYSVGFRVKDPKDVLVQVTPGLEQKPAKFTG